MFASIQQVRKIGVAGAGVMGWGIALTAAQSGYETVWYDLREGAVKEGLLSIEANLHTAIQKGKLTEPEARLAKSRITAVSRTTDLVADVIIEAIVEDVEVKRTLFRDLAEANGANTVFCTNTSSIPVGRIAEGLSFAPRLAGMHFFNPPHVMKLVEIICSPWTDPQVEQLIYDLTLRFGKFPVRARDSPGFIVNRIGKMFHTEPLYLLEQNLASAETIDHLLEATGFKMGPFRLMDLIGLDANLNVTRSLYEQLHEERFRPAAFQEAQVAAGRFGKKSGQGFYRYDAGNEKESVR